MSQEIRAGCSIKEVQLPCSDVPTRQAPIVIAEMHCARDSSDVVHCHNQLQCSAAR